MRHHRRAIVYQIFLSQIVLSLTAAAASQAQTLNTVASFPVAYGSPSGLFQASDGNFYGTAGGPPSTPAVIFELTPSGTFMTLYTFPAGVSVKTLFQGSDGNFYGTSSPALVGANSDFGAFFEFSPGGVPLTLASFGGADGAGPAGNVVRAPNKNFYGTTVEGGVYDQTSQGFGTIFRISPLGALSAPFSFDGSNGASPAAGLIQGIDGNLYGTTEYGGQGPANCVNSAINGCGTVFTVTTGGVWSLLYSFKGIADGAFPVIPLVQGADGSFYGTTSAGGTTQYGTAFNITADGAFTLLHTFTGLEPNQVTSLIQGTDGNLYGTTSDGGSSNCPGPSAGTSGCGTIFQMTTSGTITTLYQFCSLSNCADGQSPVSLFEAQDGSFYGITSEGGANGLGTVFQFVPAGPVIAPTRGVVNGASFQPGIAPGSWMTITGTDLSPVTDTWNSSIINGALPTELDGVKVMVAGQPAYIEYVSPGQINAIAPNVAPGSSAVTVTSPSGSSLAVSAEVQAVAPAFFLWGNYAVATRQDFTDAVNNGVIPGLTTTPAAPGDVIILWGTGFGPASPAAPVGMETPSDTTYNTASAVSVMVGDSPATVYGAALAPGFAGLYQVAIQIPAGLANGDYPIVASINGVASPSTTIITVQQ